MIKFLLLFIFLIGNLFGGDLTSNQASMPTRITNSTGSLVVDVIQESGVNKLQVKASIVPDLGQLFQNKALNGASSDLAVNGSVTPVIFNILADPTRDKLVDFCALYFLDNGIKVEKFLGENSPLTNGILISIQSDGQMFEFFPIKRTVDLDVIFSTDSFNLVFSAGGDYVAARFKPSVPFVLKSGTSDYIRVTIRDNLNSVIEGEFLCDGTFD